MSRLLIFIRLIALTNFAGHESAKAADAIEAIEKFSLIQQQLADQKPVPCADKLATQPNAPSPNNCSDDGSSPEPHSPNLEKFQALLKNGDSASLQDFLILWDPTPPKADNNYFEKCKDPVRGNSPLKGNDVEISEECKPDVLYSWGPKEKLATFQKSMSQSGKWNPTPNPGYGSVWATLSPITTNSCATWPVRIKFKKSTRFPYGSNYSTVGSGKVTVMFNSQNNFIFDQSDVVESWSYGTQEHYDEIVKDLQRLYSKKSFVGYSMRDNGYFDDAPSNPLKSIDGACGFFNSPEKEIKTSLLELIRTILNREGHVYYAPGVLPQPLPAFC